MSYRWLALGAAAVWLLATAAQAPAGQTKALIADAEAPPAVLTVLPPRTDYRPRMTPWGEPDFRGAWPLNHLAGLPLQRSPDKADRAFLTEPEFQQRQRQIGAVRGAVAADYRNNKLDDGVWVEMTGAGRRTSMLVDPPNGRLPELTPEGKRQEKLGRSSWVRTLELDQPTDFDSWERCITRGFPASMLPFSHDNGVRIFQSPGVMVIQLEMIHEARIIPTDGRPAASPSPVKSWMGVSRGRWEGRTLVIETTNIRPGASPLNQQTIGAPRNNTIPMSPEARVVERLTMTGPSSIDYEMTYSDPSIWTAPFTVRLDWRRDDAYRLYEYACHEGNLVVRNLILSSRYRRAHPGR